MTDGIMDEDLYGLLGVEPGASISEIQKALRLILPTLCSVRAPPLTAL